MSPTRQCSVSLMMGRIHHTRLIGDERKAGKTDEAIVGFSRCYKVTLMTPSTPIKTQSQYDQKKLFRWLMLTNESAGVHSCYRNTTCRFMFLFWLFFCQLSHQQGSFRLMLPNVWVHVNYYLPSPLSHIATQIFCALNNLRVQTISSETVRLCRQRPAPWVHRDAEEEESHPK